MNGKSDHDEDYPRVSTKCYSSYTNEQSNDGVKQEEDLTSNFELMTQRCMPLLFYRTWRYR